MSSTNRIPRDSVSFSNSITKINQNSNQEKSKKEPSEILTKEQELAEKEMFLSRKEQEIIAIVEQIKLEKEKLEESKNDMNNEKVRMLQEIEIEKENFEKEKAMEIQIMKDFMWNSSVMIAERIIRKSIELKQVELIDLLKGSLKELPIAFSKLEITAHPETVELIKEANNKDTWLLSDVEWKYNFDLEIGDFIIEHEDEIYNATMKEQLDNLKKYIEEQRKETYEE